MPLIEKETPTHRIQVEMSDEGLVDGTAIYNSMICLGLTIRPTQTKVFMGTNYRIVLQAHTSFTPEDFFEEHLEFMDAFKEVEN